ncbi:MAG TPA: antibiotic biosynthesis monooxygenase [Amycolatopsis sp.]|uniref:putative quinol monooxygenase n=1 Tax=Amycolatopsis sp. TaxID=37632 RepID=UPI002B47C12A|nr:antibiotic biosynthesis monooxygenase [Amycolatopsis sp.]HKS46985.1 antibiotic biosynthesis monooxygenase [Amycolatopsis sp.]
MDGIVILSWTDFEDDDRVIYLEHAASLMEASAKEPGCVRHVVAPDPHSSTAVIAHAHYVDARAFEAHVAGEPFESFLAATRKCRVRARNTDRFEVKKIN